MLEFVKNFKALFNAISSILVHLNASPAKDSKNSEKMQKDMNLPPENIKEKTLSKDDIIIDTLTRIQNIRIFLVVICDESKKL